MACWAKLWKSHSNTDELISEIHGRMQVHALVLGVMGVFSFGFFGSW
jgi:hypothetical protein